MNSPTVRGVARLYDKHFSAVLNDKLMLAFAISLCSLRLFAETLAFYA